MTSVLGNVMVVIGISLTGNTQALGKITSGKEAGENTTRVTVPWSNLVQN